MVREGRFREDLFYRLEVVPVRLPPLRERREDVPLIAMAALRKVAEKNGKSVTGFQAAALSALEAYLWPGNVRELIHAVERAVILCRGERIEVSDLPEALRTSPEPGPKAGSPQDPPSLLVPLGTPMEEIERIVIRETLRQTRGDKNLAAQLLGIAARTIYRKLDRDEEGRLMDTQAKSAHPPDHE
jgi:two-component system response regulator HydG